MQFKSEITKISQIERIIKYNVVFLKDELMLSSYIINLIIKFITVRDVNVTGGLIVCLALFVFFN